MDDVKRIAFSLHLTLHLLTFLHSMNNNPAGVQAARDQIRLARSQGVTLHELAHRTGMVGTLARDQLRKQAAISAIAASRH